jgi:glycosyltransferase involved in cell wall biosynthesis
MGSRCNVIGQDSDPVLANIVTEPRPSKTSRRLRVLFVVEGYTDIRFVTGLCGICELTLLVPAKQYRASGLQERILASGVAVKVDQLEGGRLRYQIDCLRYLLKNVRNFDVILSQEVLRGSLNSCLVGKLRGKPVVTYMSIPPLEYFRCRRQRRQLGWIKAGLGSSLIRMLSWTSGKLATRCVAIGPYLVEVASRYGSRVSTGYYYGVDTALFCPATDSDKIRLRMKLNLPADKFIILSGSRVSHEKDPETVLQATSLARAQGLDAVVLNLGGGFQDFVRLAKELSLPEADKWVLGRPAVHPMKELADYYRAADMLVQASLEEGAGMTTLEGLACGIPVVCTAVGGMARIMPGYARLTPKRDAEAMAREFLWVSAHPAQSRAQALQGRELVCREWSRERAFASLGAILAAAAGLPGAEGA